MENDFFGLFTSPVYMLTFIAIILGLKNSKIMFKHNFEKWAWSILKFRDFNRGARSGI